MSETTSDEQPFEIILDNRLYTIWEKCEALALRIYNANVGWIDGRPTTAPGMLYKMAEEFLAMACEMDAIARNVEVEDRQSTERQHVLTKTFAETIAQFERDRCTKRLGEIVRTPHEPPGLTS